MASSFSQTRIAMMAETGKMVGASFLSKGVTVGAASFRPPKARNLLSSALPFNVVAPPAFLLVRQPSKVNSADGLCWWHLLVQ